MEFDLIYSYQIGNHPGRTDTVKAEAYSCSDPNAQHELQVGFPKSIKGKLIGSSAEVFRDLKSRKDVEISMIINARGKRYRFSRLEEDGTFELVADGWYESSIYN